MLPEVVKITSGIKIYSLAFITGFNPTFAGAGVTVSSVETFKLCGSHMQAMSQICDPWMMKLNDISYNKI